MDPMAIAAPEATRSEPTWREMVHTFLRIGVLSFGGPAAQISLMHRVLVDEKRWLSEKAYLNALGFCMLLPGPEAMQLATYAGWRLRGVLGGLLAGGLFVGPGALLIPGLAAFYAALGNLPAVAALFLGVKAAVLVIVIEALLRVSKRALTAVEHWTTAAFAFVGIFLFAIPFPLIVLVAGVFGFLSASRRSEPPVDAPRTAISVPVSVRTTVTTLGFWLALWWAPVVLIDQFSGLAILTEIGVFFSKLAVVTFGGAYAVLAYMAQQVVSDFAWLTAGEMMDGLGLAETTPGPLILVTEFVGFLAGYRSGGVWLGVGAALVTLWVTFVPCFLWIFVGAPYIDRIAAQPRLSGALSAITAAVVGVILNLSIWFALHVTFATVERHEIGPVQLWLPDPASVDLSVIALAAVSGFLLLKLHWGVGRVLLVAATLGWSLSVVA